MFAAITPILVLGRVLGRVNFKAWIPFVLLWITFVYTVNAFLIWGGGYFAAHGALDYSGGYVIHLSAGVSGFVLAWVIGPRLQRDREIDAPNNLLMVASGAGLLWLGWNGFNGGDPYFAGANASAAVINTNLCTAVAMLVWIAWDHIYRDKPSMIGTVNGMITGLVGITPAAGFVNGWGAIIVGVVAATIVWMAIRYLSRRAAVPQRRRHARCDLHPRHRGAVRRPDGWLPRRSGHVEYIGVHGAPNLPGKAGLLFGGGWTLLRWQAETAVWVIVFTAVATFIILKLVGLCSRCGSPTRSWRSAITRSTATRCTPRMCPPWGSAPADMAADAGCGGRSDVGQGRLRRSAPSSGRTSPRRDALWPRFGGATLLSSMLVQPFDWVSAACETGPFGGPRL